MERQFSIEACDLAAAGKCPLSEVVRQLHKIIQIQASQIEKQAKRISELEQRIDELTDSSQPHPASPKFKPNRNTRKRRKKPGRKKGHIGVGRKAPAKIDETVECRLAQCPNCHGVLEDSDVVKTREHVQEEIIPAQVKTTLYRHRNYNCPHCGGRFRTKPQGDEIPHAKVGPRVLLVAAIYKHEFRLPYRKISQMLADTCGLKISPSGLLQGVQRLTAMMQGEMEVITAAIRDGPNVNVDESGWRLDGINHWIWAFANHHYSLYRIDRRRSSVVPLALLGQEYRGVLVSDFYSAYSPLPYKKQKCHVHLLRELHQVGKKNNSEEFHQFRKKLKRLLGDSLRLSDRRETFAPEVYARRRKRLRKRMRVIAVETHEDNDCKRLAKRLLKHGEELLTFLDYPDVDKDNNRAERAIRPNTVVRKISGGNRSIGGVRAHETIMSISETLKKQGKNWFDFGTKVIANARDGITKPVLKT